MLATVQCFIDAAYRLCLSPADHQLRHHERCDLLRDGKLAAQVGKASHAQLHITGQLEVARAIKAAGQRALQAQAIDATDRGHAADTAGLGAISCDQNLATAVGKRHTGRTGTDRGMRISGCEGPALCPCAVFVEHQGKAAAQLRRAKPQVAGHVQHKHLSTIGQHQITTRGQCQHGALLVIGTIPVDDDATRSQQASAGHLAVDLQCGLVNVGTHPRGQGRCTHVSLGGDPATGGLVVRHKLGRQNDGQIGVGQSCAHAGIAKAGIQIGTADHELIDTHLAAIGQKHALVHARFNEKLT